MDDGKIVKLRRLAETIAKDAGDELRNSSLSSRDVVLSMAHDVKIRADAKINEWIVERLCMDGRYDILAEESAIKSADPFGKEPVWVVDPLDGSLNFARKIPLSCVSIGLWQKGDPLIGVVYDFTRNEMFSGSISEGAFLNKHAIKTSSVTNPTEAILCTGVPAAAKHTEAALYKMIQRICKFRKLRWLGSAALSLSYVAAGRVDAYEEDGICIWDVAAGLALVKAAGGNVVCHRRESSNELKVAATNGFLPVNII